VALRAHPQQDGGDALSSVLVLELQEKDLALIHELAGRWEQGLRALLGVVGAAGLVGAPLAQDRLTTTAQTIVGVLLAAVMLLAVGGIWLAMNAAHGSLRRTKPPATMTEYAHLRVALANSKYRNLLWGRRLTLTALVLLTAAITVSWVSPPP
jgi:hypothetical protein